MVKSTKWTLHTIYAVVIGDLYAVSRNFRVVIRRNNKYSLLLYSYNKVEAWDYNVLWLRITENEVKTNMKDKIPSPRQYFIKDYLYYTVYTGYNYPLPVISRRYSEQPLLKK